MKIKIRQHLRRLGRYSRYLLYLALVLGGLLSAAYGTARWYWPEILASRINVEQLLSRVTQREVRVARVEPYWDKLWPGLRAVDITVYGRDRRPSMQLAEARLSVSLWPLLWQEIRLHSLVLERPILTVSRSVDGKLQVAGLEPVAGEPSGTAFDRLLKQRKIIVNNGALRWQDAREPSGGFVVSNIDVKWRNNGDRHRLSVRATFPPGMCRACALDVDITGDPRLMTWSGDIDIEAQGIDAVKLPMIVRDRLPSELRGQFDVTLNSDWQAARPRAARGALAVKDLRLPLSDLSRPLQVRQAATDIAWRVSGDGWRLDLDRLTLALVGQPWSAGRLSVVHSSAENILQIRHIELGDITAFIAGMKAEHAWLQRWVEARPGGMLNNIQVRSRGSLASPTTLEARAQLQRVQFSALERIPGIKGLSGRLTASLVGGEFDLDAQDFELDMPTVFRKPLAARRASGTVHWERNENEWQVSGAGLRVQSADGAGSGSLRLMLPHDHAQSPVLRLQVDFKNMNGANASRYYPTRHLKPHVIKWMESSFLGGRVTSGSLVYDGPTRQFPFAEGQGRFELRAHAKEAIYGYLPGWAPITHAEVDVVVDGPNVRVDGHGKIGALRVNDVHVEAHRATGQDHHQVDVQVKVEGPVVETLRVLQTAKPRQGDWPAQARLITAATGEGALDLKLRLPLDGSNEHDWNAEYRFTKASLKLQNGAGLDQASGVLRLSDSGLEGGGIHAQFFGGPLTLFAENENGALRVRANGQMQLTELLRGNRALAERVSGLIDWSGTWSTQARGPQVQGEARLVNWRARLPAPLNRPDGGFPERVVLSTEQSRAEALVLALQAGNDASGRLAFNREQGRWKFTGGRIELGKSAAVLPRQGGLQLGLTADALNVDEWLPFLQSGSSGGEMPNVVNWASVDIRQLGLFGRRWGRLMTHLMRAENDWRVVLDGEALAGEGRITAGGSAKTRLRFDLAHLRIPEASRERGAKAKVELSDPRRLPAVELIVRSLEYHDRQFGALDLSAAPNEQGWRIDRLRLTRPEATLAINGIWRVRGEQQLTELNADLTSTDMGATLTAWGAPEQMDDGKVTLHAKASWPGSPVSPTLSGLNGRLELSAEKGRFLQVKAGATRLFGLLDLRSIGRYLTLDFSPAFGKGFTFDEASGVIAVDRGNAYTSDLAIRGPALGLAMRGRIGLVAEDYDLAIDASPKLSNTLTFASWGLFGPQTAAAVFALQKLFKRQINDGTRVTYLVKGPWNNPSVKKLAEDSSTKDVPAPSAPR